MSAASPEALAELAAAARRGVGILALTQRELVEVTGRDRARWLGGMVSNEVSSLAAGEGCPALVLTHKGRVVAEVQVLTQADAIWLECADVAAAAMIAQLGKSIVADDVILAARGASLLRYAIEGANAAALVEAVAAAAGSSLTLPARNASSEFELSGARVVVAGFGFSGAPAFQLFALDATPAQAEALASALRAAGEEFAGVSGDDALLDVLRIEAGRASHAAEAEGALPAEVALEFAVAPDKGCYTGQEVVAKLQSRAKVNRLLVGVEFGGPAPAGLPVALLADAREVGKLTSACLTKSGWRGLAIVRREHAEVGTELVATGMAGPVRVTALPHAAATDA